MTVRALRPTQTGAPSPARALPDTLRLLRERLGMTKSDVAKKLGRSASYVTRCEAPHRDALDFGAQEAESYATILQVPVNALGQKFTEPTLAETHFRTRILTAKKKREVIARAGLIVNHVNQLLDIVDARTIANIPKFDVSRLGAREAGISAAQKIRRLWNLGLSPIRDLAGLIEAQGVFVTDMRGAAEGVRGMTVLLGSEATPVIFVSAYPSEDARRLTLAHELGHLVMDEASGLLSNKEIEDRATSFAGELLAPWSQVAGRVEGLVPSEMAKLTSLQREWGVHPNSFIQRGYLEGAFTENQRRNWFVNLNARKLIIDNTRCDYPIKPTAIGQLVANVFDLGWSEAQLSYALGGRPEELARDLDGWSASAAA